ncbi:hypothetical protein [Leptospira kirschneri]|uniref:Uncharacterized protein n=1 Tax=Leptospira kirschneri serovar Bulgarica str. Nikolaevo TaxID=1240687 RepID=M6F1W3_9LEPT|nr:hypothetical protein [Leptospira kirschneri]EMK22370.1 hypothetical protein LEP1GSC008_1579 [Leptospira kirschneri serovar Bulgarica str. Nikolaevo]EMK24535.1 hypothetical protein LEP1GSC008_2652 [Leptospira kirschneri serovar Bulgarica str. Nikolaevo]EMK24906.1 hypothetical protein LEP1GSC008_0578 [Leptospira kirschneri serovar Bulgarica str. Nikolaevo]
MTTLPAIRERAFFLYAISGSGSSLNAVAKQIREEFETKTTAKTVKEWAEEKDKDGLTWKDKRNRLVVRTEKRVEILAENRLLEIKSRTKNIVDSLYNMLTSKKAPGLTSFENAVYAFKNISEYELKLEKMEGDRLHPLTIVNAIFEVLQECPPVAQAIQENWDKSIATRVAEKIGSLKG